MAEKRHIEAYSPGWPDSRVSCGKCTNPPDPNRKQCCAYCLELKQRCPRNISARDRHCGQHGAVCAAKQRELKKLEATEGQLFFPGLLGLSLDIMRSNKAEALHFPAPFVQHLRIHPAARHEYLHWLYLVIALRKEITEQCFYCHPDEAHLKHIKRLGTLARFLENPPY